jgi:hypothetical protein
MDTHSAPQITAKTICDAIGRKVIADHIGASLTAVSNASTDGKFPARWYPGIRELCAAAEHPCPDEAFNFVIPAATPAKPTEAA